MRANYHTVFNPPPQDLQVIDHGFYEYNVAHLGEAVVRNYARLAIFVRDEDANVIGRIYGELIWSWLYVQTLWVDQACRGQGIGSQLLALAEQAALERGFYKCHLDFYLKRSYEVFGELEGKPAGSTWYYIKKEIG